VKNMGNFLKIEFFTILDASGGRLRLNSTNFLQFWRSITTTIASDIRDTEFTSQPGFPLATALEKGRVR
jgi:hypothetical protein